MDLPFVIYAEYVVKGHMKKYTEVWRKCCKMVVCYDVYMAHKHNQLLF